MGIKQDPVRSRPYTVTHFCCESAHIDCLRSQEHGDGGIADDRGRLYTGLQRLRQVLVQIFQR